MRATVASWGYEARVSYLRRRLKHAPLSAPNLIEQGLWTGDLDAVGSPIPSDKALVSGLWQREVFPIYTLPEPMENRRLSLRDTLALSDEDSPHLVAVGLWTGQYDDEGLPIPTPSVADPRRGKRKP